MKRQLNSIAALGLGLVMIFCYAIPTIVTDFEDKHLETEQKTFEMEAIELDYKAIDMIEELRIFPELLEGNIIVQRDKEESENSKKYQQMKASVERFLQYINSEKEIVFDEFSTSYVVMADEKSGNVYPLWKCACVDEDNMSYIFWIDDLTGLVMAYELPITAMERGAEDISMLLENLKEYYGFSEGVIIGDPEMLKKQEYWDGGLLFQSGITASTSSDDDELQYFYQHEVYLPLNKLVDIICFNMYPGTMKVYDSSELIP